MLKKRNPVLRKLAVLAAMLAVALAAAAPALAQSGVGVATGVLEKPEVTTYQYGTHALTDEASGTRYALQSESVNLDAYVGERVTIYGTPVPGYQDGQVEGGPDLLRVDRVVPADGPPSEMSATFSFELAVECEPPAGATFFGQVPAESLTPVQLTDPDGDGLYTGSKTVPRFAPGPTPPGTEPVSLPVRIVQGPPTVTGPLGPEYRVIEDFGTVTAEDRTFSTSVSFCDDEGSDKDGSGNDSGDGLGNGSGTVNDDTGAGDSSSSSSGSGSANTSGTAAASGSGAKTLPATGGALPIVGLLGALLVGGGLLARRIAR